MNKNELIVKQQLEIEELKEKIKIISSEISSINKSAVFIENLNRNDEGVNNLAFNFAYDCSIKTRNLIQEI